MIFITPPSEPPRREIVRDGITYREVRMGDDMSIWSFLGCVALLLFVGMPALLLFMRWFFIPVADAIFR